jgi:hypothetical protein
MRSMWYGVWDFVCENPEPFEHKKNTFCGPACVLNGTYTTMCASLPALHLRPHAATMVVTAKCDTGTSSGTARSRIQSAATGRHTSVDGAEL